MEIKHRVVKLNVRTSVGKNSRISFFSNLLITWQELSDEERAKNLCMRAAVVTAFTNGRPMLVSETVEEIDAMVEGREGWESGDV